jgi:hypothetical protein
MTECLGVSAAEAAVHSLGLYAAAEAPLFHGIALVRTRTCEIKIKVKGSGQECPLHTSMADALEK